MRYCYVDMENIWKNLLVVIMKLQIIYLFIYLMNGLICPFQLQAIRESRKYALAGALLGGAHLGGVSLKYSKSPHGNVLLFTAIPGGKKISYSISFSVTISPACQRCL